MVVPSPRPIPRTRAALMTLRSARQARPPAPSRRQLGWTPADMSDGPGPTGGCVGRGSALGRGGAGRTARVRQGPVGRVLHATAGADLAAQGFRPPYRTQGRRPAAARGVSLRSTRLVGRGGSLERGAWCLGGDRLTRRGDVEGPRGKRGTGRGGGNRGGRRYRLKRLNQHKQPLHSPIVYRKNNACTGIQPGG